jgi:hypothetical protein
MSANANPGSANPINFDTKLFDTHAAVTTGVGTWKFTAPVSGFYQIESVVQLGAAVSLSLFLYKNGSQYQYYNASATAGFYLNGSSVIQLNAGDFIDLRVNASATFNGGGPPYESMISINRLSGPSVIAVSESVNADYSATATASITSGTTTFLDFPTENFDTHSAMTGAGGGNTTTAGTGCRYVVPVAGKYLVAYTIEATAYGVSATVWEGFIYKNTTKITEFTTLATATTLNYAATQTRLVQCVAGDTLQIAVSQNSGGSRTLTTNSYFSVARVGN